MRSVRKSLPTLAATFWLASLALGNVAFAAEPVAPPDEWLSPDQVKTIKLVLPACGAALLLWGLALRRVGRADSFRRLRDGLLLLLGVLAGLSWWNFFEFHHIRDPGPIQQVRHAHLRDAFHYYVGAKYFRELGYTRLYECVAIADLDVELKFNVARRLTRDLATNDIGRPTAVVKDPTRCTAHFSDERWSMFKRDIS